MIFIQATDITQPSDIIALYNSIKNLNDNKIVSILSSLYLSLIIALSSSLFLKKKEHVFGLFLVSSIILFFLFLNHEIKDIKDIHGFFFSIKGFFMQKILYKKFAFLLLIAMIWYFFMSLFHEYSMIIMAVLILCVFMGYIIIDLKLNRDDYHSTYNLLNHLLVTSLVVFAIYCGRKIILPKYRGKYIEFIHIFFFMFAFIRLFSYFRSDLDFSFKNMDLFQRLSLLLACIFDIEHKNALDIVTNPIGFIVLLGILSLLYRFHVTSFLVLSSILIFFSIVCASNALLNYQLLRNSEYIV